MFKGIINTFKGSRNNATSWKVDADCIEEQKDHCKLAEPTNKSSKIGRKSRKRLMAMMGKIGSSVQTNGKSKQVANGYKSNDDLADELKDIAPEDSLGDQLHEDDHANDDDDYGSDDECKDKLDQLLVEEQCDLPTFLHTKNCDPNLVDETRRLLKERYLKNPEAFYDHDYERMLVDDWTVSRFLLRRRLDPKRAAKLMEECGRFRKQYKMSEVQLWEFPVEFHKAGGLFKYAPDRVGNLTVYMRVKMYRRVPEISDVFKAFILCVLEQADVENNGRGVAVIFDLSSCGLQNVDLSFLSWLLSSFRNYCPKGLSYIIVYNLPWILSATAKLSMSWMSSNNRRSLRFVNGDEIEHFIARENLPDYLGGTCKINYRAIPQGSLPATEVCSRLEMTKEQALKIRELFKDYLDDDDDETNFCSDIDQDDYKSLPDESDYMAAIETTTKGSTNIVSQASKFIA